MRRNGGLFDRRGLYRLDIPLQTLRIPRSAGHRVRRWG